MNSSETSYAILTKAVLEAITNIPEKTLQPETVMFLGVGDVEKLLCGWGKLQKNFASAMLAIVKEEFAIRFPNY